MKITVPVKGLFLLICLLVLSASSTLAQTTSSTIISTTTTVVDTTPPDPPCGFDKPCPCSVEIQGNGCSFITWETDFDPDLAGYRIRVGSVSEDYEYFIDVGNVTTYDICGLNHGVTYITT